MSEYELLLNSVNTNATINATATSAALLAATAGASWNVRHISTHADTTTTNRIAFSFLFSTGANAFTRSLLTAGDVSEINIEGGWLLPTGAGLYMALSATSTPTFRVAVVADLVDRP